MGKLLLLLSVLVAGCATTEILTVPGADYRQVPVADRAKLDTASDAAYVQARTEQLDAVAALEAARARLGTPAAHKAVPPSTDDARAKSDVLARVDAATLAARQAELTWRQRRVEAATARLSVVTSDRELARAMAVDRDGDSDTPYDVAPYRGQLAHAQDTWYADQARVEQARADLQRTEAAVMTAKQAYAELLHAEAAKASAAVDQAIAATKSAPPPAKARRSAMTASSKH